MKRLMKGILFLLATIISVAILLPPQVSAAAAYKTYTVTVDGERIETQTAYEAFEVLANSEMSAPQDLTIVDGQIYVVDSGTKKVIVLNRNGNVERSFGEDILVNPTGIALDVNGDIYVADRNAAKIFRFTNEGELIREYGRPEEPLFGQNTIFQPIKVEVDVRGNMYVIGEGATNGIIQLNNEGKFLGYYGANRTTTSFIQFLRDTLLSELQLTTVFSNLPPASTNLAIDQDGIVYTVTETNVGETVKKLNVAGANMLPVAMYLPSRAIDIAVGLQNNFFVLTRDGLIFEYDSTGNILFIFGSLNANSQRLGVYRDPVAIAVDELGILHVVDTEGSLIHKLMPTEFTDSVHLGLAYYEEGRYVESEEYWRDVLNQNSSFSLARVALGESSFKQQNYDEALSQFRAANNGPGYSKTFWELRNQWLENNLAFWVALLLGLWLLRKILRIVDKRKNIFRQPKEKMKAIRETKFLQEIGMMFRMIRHPIDTLYDLQNMGKGTIRQAVFWYVVLIAEYIFFLYGVGFLFNGQLTERINVMLLVGVFVGAFFLFITMNYLVSTISDGEASLKDLFIGTIHCFAPLIIGIVPLVLLSNVLTFNESFLFTFGMQVMVVWTFVLLVIMVKEMHNFSSMETLKILLLTVFAGFIFVMVLYIIYVLLIQVFDFVYSVFQEVMLRV